MIKTIFFKRFRPELHPTTLLLPLLLVLLVAVPAGANELRIENVRFFSNGETDERPRVVFDLAWKNSWRNARNHDAVWIFFKYPDDNFDRHARIAADGHATVETALDDSPPAEFVVPPDRTGLFVRAARDHRGDVRWRLSVVLDTEDLDRKFLRNEPKVYGIEMVHVPRGAFTLGDTSPEALAHGSFYRADAKGEPDGLIRVGSEQEIPVGPSAGALYYQEGDYQGDRTGPVPAAFPKGFKAFYTMKYELTQGQYADFLNSIADRATFYRVNFMGRSYYANKGTIRLDGSEYVAGKPDRPMNFMTWDDGLAFADWAALRPMTELEFTKASRGPRDPKPGEFPWGTSDTDRLKRLVNRENDLVFIGGWDESALSDETLADVGASPYWVLDLSGSVWERVVTIGSKDGRAFTGTHGDGRLNGDGYADNADWPHTYEDREGHGYRGGAFYFQGKPEGVFNPYSPVAYRLYGAWSGSYPHMAYGFRCVRTAPEEAL